MFTIHFLNGFVIKGVSKITRIDDKRFYIDNFVNTPCNWADIQYIIPYGG